MATNNMTYARKENLQKKVASRHAATAEESAPFGQAIQSLYSLVDLMRNMSPESGTPLSPKLILSATGLEIRFNGSAVGAAPVTAAEAGAPDQLSRIERSLQQLSERVGKMEAQLGTESEAVASLRAAVQQNEEMMETLVDSMNMMDELGQSDLGPELVLGPGTRAS